MAKKAEIKFWVKFSISFSYFTGLPHELLKEVVCEDVWENDDLEGTGFELMECAADMGDQSAVLFVAHAYETGRFLGPAKYVLKKGEKSITKESRSLPSPLSF